MNKIFRLYWIFTILLSAFVLLTSLTQVFVAKSSEDVMQQLSMPVYLLPFLGVAKLLGIITLLQPRFPKLKEWAYAGLLFDFIGATYAMIAIGGPVSKWGFMALPILLWWLSYFYYQKTQPNASARPSHEVMAFSEKNH